MPHSSMSMDTLLFAFIGDQFLRKFNQKGNTETASELVRLTLETKLTI